MNAGHAATIASLQVIYMILDFYMWMLIVGAVMSWLVAFGIINNYNRFVQVVGDFIYRATEPLLRPLRRIIPVVGGLDLAPMALIFIIYFLQSFISHLVI